MNALDGIRVLDLTIWQQGPMTTAMLADWGADVIKIEGPDSPDPGRSLVRYDAGHGGPNAYFETHNRNKRGIVLDLKSEAGRDVFYRLVEGRRRRRPELPPRRRRAPRPRLRDPLGASTPASSTARPPASA